MPPPACFHPAGQLTHAVLPGWLWNLPAAQLLHDAFFPWSWNCPYAQLLQDPVPALPATQSVHAVLMLLTAQPAPLLQLVPVWNTSFHVLAGHAPHTMSALGEHAVLRFSPPPHEPHSLHAEWPDASWYEDPDEHCEQLVLPVVAWTQPAGQLVHAPWRWLVLVWYVPAPQLPQLVLAVVEQLVSFFWPAPHEPHPLHAVAPAEPW